MPEMLEHQVRPSDPSPKIHISNMQCHRFALVCWQAPLPLPEGRIRQCVIATQLAIEMHETFLRLMQTFV